MDHFTITCTTCKSRLKVREQAAIGQILACPKCGGMVMVKPPPNWSDVKGSKLELPTKSEVMSAAPATSAPLASSAFDAVDDLLSDAPPKAAGSGSTSIEFPTAPRGRRDSPATAVKPRFVGGPPLPPPPPSTKAASGMAEAPADGQPAAALAKSSDSSKLAPPPPAETDTERPAPVATHPTRLRFWMVAAGSGAVGVVLAFAAVWLALYFVRHSRPKAKYITAGSATTQSPGISTPQAPAGTPPVSPSTREASETIVPAPAAEVASTPASASAKSPAPANVAAPDPVGIVNDAAPSPGASASAGDSLAKFDRFIEGANESPSAKLPEEKPVAPVASTLPEAAPSRPPAPRPPPREVDVAKRLADPLLGIESTSTPLADFLQLISDYSTIPITLEVDALAIVNVSAETPVAIKAVNTTIGAALAEALKALKLEYVVSGDQLVVRLTEPGAPSPIEMSCKDLTDGSEQQLAELAELLKAAVEPAAWSSGENKGEITPNPAKNSLVVRNRRAVQGQVLLACDKLRVARGKAPQLKIAPAILKVESRWSKAKARLEAPVSLNFAQPARLVSVLERLGAAAGVRILVDWGDVASVGWNPAAEATLVADKLTLAAALDALVGPLDLAWRVVDGQTVEVLTPARLAERVETEVYRVEAALAADPTGLPLLEQIRAALGEGSFRDAGGLGELRIDTEGKCLLVALPQAKQRELEALLAK